MRPGFAESSDASEPIFATGTGRSRESDRGGRERGCGRRDVEVGAGPDRWSNHPWGGRGGGHRGRDLSAAVESAFPEGARRGAWLEDWSPRREL